MFLMKGVLKVPPFLLVHVYEKYLTGNAHLIFR